MTVGICRKSGAPVLLGVAPAVSKSVRGAMVAPVVAAYAMVLIAAFAEASSSGWPLVIMTTKFCWQF